MSLVGVDDEDSSSFGQNAAKAGEWPSDIEEVWQAMVGASECPLDTLISKVDIHMVTMGGSRKQMTIDSRLSVASRSLAESNIQNDAIVEVRVLPASVVGAKPKSQQTTSCQMQTS